MHAPPLLPSPSSALPDLRKATSPPLPGARPTGRGASPLGPCPAIMGSRRQMLLGAGSWLALQAPRCADAAMPLSDLRKDCSVEPLSEDVLVRAQALRRLFPHGMPRAADVHQGNFNDCYFLAALAAAAHKYPMLIKSRLRYLRRRVGGTRDYSVRLLWPTPHGAPRMGIVCTSDDISPRSAKGALWVAMFEKAFAKFNSRRTILPLARLPGYDALQSGAHGEGIAALTGSPTQIVHFANRTAACPVDPHIARRLSDLFRDRGALGFVTFNYWPRTHLDADKTAAFDVQFRDGSQLMAGAYDDVIIFKRPNKPGLVLYGHHAYAVLEVNARGDMLFYNPHGTNPRAGDGTGKYPRKKALPGTFWLERDYLDHVVVTAYVGKIAPATQT